MAHADREHEEGHQDRIRVELEAEGGELLAIVEARADLADEAEGGALSAVAGLPAVPPD